MGLSRAFHFLIYGLLCAGNDAFLGRPLPRRPLRCLSAKDRDDDVLRRLESVMLKVVQEQRLRLEEQEVRIRELEKQMRDLRAIVLDSEYDGRTGAAATAREEAFGKLASTLNATLLQAENAANSEVNLEADQAEREEQARRLQGALDVPGDLYDAADDAGAAVLAAILQGQRRILVTFTDDDPSLAASPSPDFSSSSSSDDDSEDASAERLARFVELMALPTTAALEGFSSTVQRSRLRILFNTMRQLAAARRVMALPSSSPSTPATTSTTSASDNDELDPVLVLGAVSLGARVEPLDSVLVLVEPCLAEETGSGGGAPSSDKSAASSQKMRALLKEAENCTIVLVNPHFDGDSELERLLETEYEPVYVLADFNVTRAETVQCDGVRGLVLRQFPQPWQVFIQTITQEEEEEEEAPELRDGESDEGDQEDHTYTEQPWIFVESFTSEPSDQDTSAAVLKYQGGIDAAELADDAESSQEDP